jgi:glycosyltransferase involved in cell wall biosynthesis
MRILHVTHQYRPVVGGAEQHITDQSEELAQRGHQVDVFTSRSSDYRTWQRDAALPAVEQLSGVNVYRFTSFKRGPLAWKLLNRGLRGYWRTRSARYTPFIVWGNGPVSLPMMWALLRHGRQYDVIHVNSLHYAPVFYSHRLARQLGVPFAITPFVHIDQPAVFDVEFQNTILRDADLVLAMTTLEKDYLIARGVRPERITVSGAGLHLDQQPQIDQAFCRQQLNLPLDAYVVLFMARKERYKGLQTLLAACDLLQQDCPNLYLIAAGMETDDSRQLREQYAGLPHVINWEYIDPRQKQYAFNACDMFALPSVGESFGLVYIEAWAVRKPVIGAASGAIPALITDGVDGLLIEPNNAADAARKISQLYHDAALGCRMGAAGYAKVLARYTTTKVADVVEAAYRRVVRRHHSRLSYAVSQGG